MNASSPLITVGELIARFLEGCGVKTAYGVISIHNMPILDAFHQRQRIRFISSRGEAGACNMADAGARVSGVIGVCVTSTGTGCGNAAGAMVEATTAGTPLLHLTGQIESEYVDRDLGFIHEHPDQLGMLRSVGKAAWRISDPASALDILREAVRCALTPPCGPVSIEIPIDVQGMTLPLPADLSPAWPEALAPDTQAVDHLAQRMLQSRRPLIWVGGGARGAVRAVRRLADMGIGVVSSVQGRGILPEDHPSSLAAYNLQKPVEAFYASVDGLLVVGSRLRSNETLTYKLSLPERRWRIDADAAAQGRAYSDECFVQGDAQLTLDALADALQGRLALDPAYAQDLRVVRKQAEALVDGTLGPYVALKEAVQTQVGSELWWVRDITLSNTMWGNRGPLLNHPRAGVHALGGGIGQGLAMGIGVAIANAEHGLGRKTVVLSGDGGFMLNVGELACAVQERADLLVLLMNDARYGVIRNIQDAVYGSRHCYVDLVHPQFQDFCASFGVPYFRAAEPARMDSVLQDALAVPGPVVLEVDMQAWGAFPVKFAGPPRKTP